MDQTDKVKVVMRWIFAIWIFVLGLFIVISSLQVYRSTADGQSVADFKSIEVPDPPKHLALTRDNKLYPKIEDQVKFWQQEVAAYEKQVSAYEKQVDAYDKQITAHKTQMEIAAKSDLLARYKAVVTDTLIVYLGGGFFATFVSWIFANLAAGAVERFTESRQPAGNQRLGPNAEAAGPANKAPLKPIKLL